MKKLPIKMAKDVLESYGLKQVIILCRDENNIDHMVTYGKNKSECFEAGKAGDSLKKMIGWPDSTLSKYSMN